MRKSFFALVSLLLAFILFSPSCKNKRAAIPVNNPKLTLGSPVQITEQVIPVTGGSITINNPGKPLDGLSIEVPGEAFSDNEGFSISYSEILGHDFGPYLHPITPAISIANKNGWANEFMQLKIPVNIPEGHFAMPFLYDEKTRSLEAMQVTDQGEGYITITTTRFSGSEPPNASAVWMRLVKKILPAFGGDNGTDVTYGQIFVSSVSETELLKDHITPFKPGTDDWQFPNNGSFFAPGGQCSGQSLASLWYYHAQKILDKQPSLYGLYDNDGSRKTPNIWQDDALGYKFCSMMQNDWEISYGNAMLDSWQKNNDKNTLYAFCYAMMVTDEPQLVVAYNTIGEKTAHAMIVYGMSKGNLMVADPNFPGNDSRRIWWDDYNKVYMPYASADKADEPDISFPVIRYFAKSGIKSWDHAPGFWHQFKGGSIGEGAFPEYSILAMNEQKEYVPLENGFEIKNEENNLDIIIKSPVLKGDFLAFDEQGLLKQDKGTVHMRYSEGENWIGINVLDNNGEWAGFNWIKVIMGKKENTPSVFYPVKGNLHINSCSVNGVPATIDSAHFSIEDPGGLTIEGWGPRLSEGIYAFERTVKIHSYKCTGTGNFQLDSGGEGTYYWEYHSYYTEPGNIGTINITRWDQDVIEGEFSFSAKDGSGNIKLIRASFSGKLR